MSARTPNGERKILLQFERLLETENYKDEVAKIRKALDIPVEGITPTPNDLQHLLYEFRIPDGINKYPLYGNKAVNHPQVLEYKKASKELLAMLPIGNEYLKTCVRLHAYFNTFFYDELNDYKKILERENVCSLSDAEAEFYEYLPGENQYMNSYAEKLETKLWRYPVSIRIHADASQRDIVEYIKNNWGAISFLQKKYLDKNRNGSFKNSKTKVNSILKRRNDLIYKNRHLKLKEIVSILMRNGYEMGMKWMWAVSEKYEHWKRREERKSEIRINLYLTFFLYI